MKNPFKKIFSMQEKDITTSEEGQELAIEEQPMPEQNESQGDDKYAAQIKDLQQQVDDARNKFLYLMSDFENYKRNAARERIDLIQTAGRDVMAALLPILDDFDRAEKSNALSEGTTLIQQKLAHTLKSKGLIKIETQIGEDFNADLHEAVAEIPAASDEQKGKIIDILEHGYQLGERIIRFAKVVVGR